MLKILALFYKPLRQIKVWDLSLLRNNLADMCISTIKVIQSFSQSIIIDLIYVFFKNDEVKFYDFQFDNSKIICGLTTDSIGIFNFDIAE